MKVKNNGKRDGGQSLEKENIWPKTEKGEEENLSQNAERFLSRLYT